MSLQFYPYPKPDFEPDHIVVWGMWGDVLAALGNLIAHGFQNLPITYWGFDPAIARFIEAQGWGGVVTHALPANKLDYYEIIGVATRNPEGPEWKAVLEVPAKTWVGLAYTKPEEVLPNHWTPKLPEWAEEWASSYMEGSPDDSWLIFPRSDHSCPWAYHWPHWVEAVRQMIRSFPGRHLIMAGKGHEWHERHPRLTNIIGKIPTMLEVFALAEKMPGRIVTTSNGLSMWCRTRHVPAIVCANAAFQDHANYFRRWVIGGPIRLIENSDPMKTLFEELNADTNQTRGSVLPALTH